MTVIRVTATVAIQPAYNLLVPAFEAESGFSVSTEWVPTVRLMQRLEAGERPDLVIMSAAGIDRLIAAGRLQANSRIDIARSGIGIAIAGDAAAPDVGTAEALQQTLRAAGSVAYSTGPSGVYLAALFARMGLTGALAAKLRVIQGEPIGEVIKRGSAEIGFQQVPELLAVEGIRFLGPLPAELQQMTTFSAGWPVGGAYPVEGRALVRYLKTPTAAAMFKATGMEPG